jgi:hypothetical protein
VVEIIECISFQRMVKFANLQLGCGIEMEENSWVEINQSCCDIIKVR